MIDALLIILVAMGLSVLGRETWGWLPYLSRGVIWLHTMPLPKAHREIRREEWSAELAGEYEDRRLAGLFWALSLCRVSAWERVTTSLRAAVLWLRVLVYSGLADDERTGPGAERTRRRIKQEVMQLDDHALQAEAVAASMNLGEGHTEGTRRDIRESLAYLAPRLSEPGPGALEARERLRGFLVIDRVRTVGRPPGPQQ